MRDVFWRKNTYIPLLITGETSDIELALLEGALEIGQCKDAKLLSPILSWIYMHGELVNMERLRKLKLKKEIDGDLVWISAFAFFGISCGQSRWKILAINQTQLHATVDLEFAQLIVKQKGIESWANGTGFIVPTGSESIAEKHALSPSQIAENCRQYRNRLIYGTSWRADIITALENGAKNATEAAKMCRSAYEPAQRVCAELKLASFKIRL